MTNLDREQKVTFQEFLRAARGAADDLIFLLDQYAEKISIDYTEESLLALEHLFWKFLRGDAKYRSAFGTIEDFANLICRYMGETIIKHTGAQWIQTEERNHRFGQPCLDGFGNEKWERIYPIEIATHFGTLAETNPGFPGVRDKQVLATQLRKAVEIRERSQQAAACDGGARRA